MDDIQQCHLAWLHLAHFLADHIYCLFNIFGHFEV